MTRPENLVFFLSDNHNGDILGCYGHHVVKTPNMDRMASSGTRFKNSYTASPLCCPARASLATGRFPHQTHHWDNANVYDGKIPSWGHRLKAQGYETVSIGKLHYRSTDDDNGFTQELAPMHIVDDGHLTGLLRWSDDQPEMPGQWELYWEKSGIGETEYQEYDRKITALAKKWLKEEAPRLDKPWVLLVSYVSSHPPFLVPERFFDMYPPDHMPLPVNFRDDEMPRHPALDHIRRLKRFKSMEDEAALRRIAAGYFGLITHLDEQIGEVMSVAEDIDDTRMIYTSDHGESFGHHGLFGKNHLLEPSVRVPFIATGPGIKAGHVSSQIVSGVDLFPTIVEGAGLPLKSEDGDLPGVSLWPALNGTDQIRTGFVEFHASASRHGGFIWRDGNLKLIYHVEMPNQLFDLDADPNEAHDLIASGEANGRDKMLENALRDFIDPESVDAQAKADQKALVERHGGNTKVAAKKTLVYTPPPGETTKYG
jgi:choline-sulfatase